MKAWGQLRCPISLKQRSQSQVSVLHYRMNWTKVCSSSLAPIKKLTQMWPWKWCRQGPPHLPARVEVIKIRDSELIPWGTATTTTHPAKWDSGPTFTQITPDHLHRQEQAPGHHWEGTWAANSMRKASCTWYVLPHHTWTEASGPTCQLHHCQPWSPCAVPENSGPYSCLQPSLQVFWGGATWTADPVNKLPTIKDKS